MKSRNFVVFSVMAAALLLSTIAAPSMTPENALAYEKNQATSQTSDCGNEFMPINIGCQNTDSQIQGDENAAALTAQQTFPEVKLVQEKPTPKPTPMTATLEVCKDTASTEGTYEFIVTGNNPSPEQFSLMPGDCQDVTIDSGNYMISEEDPFPGQDVSVTVTGECTLTSGTTTASGNIQAGEAQACSFLNILEEPEPQTCLECFTEFLTEEQITEFERHISSNVGGNIEGLCAFWEDEATPEQIMNDLDVVAVILAGDQLRPRIADDATIQQLIDCLERVFGLQTEEPPEE